MAPLPALLKSPITLFCFFLLLRNRDQERAKQSEEVLCGEEEVRRVCIRRAEKAAAVGQRDRQIRSMVLFRPLSVQ